MATDDISPTSDLFIASLWSTPEREPILLSLLNAVMTDIGQPQIVEATVLNPFNVKEFPDDKEIRLDVRVKDETGKKYNIEVQKAWHVGFYNRTLYYWTETYEGQIQRGEHYKLLRPVCSIIITEFPAFPELKQLHAVFELRARENPAVLLTDHLQIHFLRLGNLDRQNMSGLDGLCIGLQRWMQLWAFGSEWEEKKMSAVLQDVPEVHAAYNEYKRFTADEAMREKIKARERYWIDKHLDRAEAKEEGREEGLVEGEAKKALDVAQNLKGMSRMILPVLRVIARRLVVMVESKSERIMRFLLRWMMSDWRSGRGYRRW
jgi:predicted transposase/invertase (TIGR01784 family)